MTRSLRSKGFCTCERGNSVFRIAQIPALGAEAIHGDSNASGGHPQDSRKIKR